MQWDGGAGFRVLSARSHVFLLHGAGDSCEGRYFSQRLGACGRAWLSQRLPPQLFRLGTPRQSHGESEGIS